MIGDNVIDDAEEEMQLMSKMLLQSEKRFLEFNELVPYTNNDDNVFSPVLVDLLQSIGSQIDGTFKILLNLSGQQLKQRNFLSVYKLLNQKQGLSVHMVVLKESGRRFQPFTSDLDKPPKWWSAYNNVKHDLPKGAYSGTYGNVINALGALNILHRLADFGLDSKGLKPHVLDAKNWSNLLEFWELQDQPDSVVKKIIEPDQLRSLGEYSSTVFYSPTLYNPKE